mmetsp:Transcript_9807/g.14266  ORF Transcript_9807/g.14266 Transcript_9807/m.14266 type:complete len:110 (-) Transcript_9807:14-343(-)
MSELSSSRESLKSSAYPRPIDPAEDQMRWQHAVNWAYWDNVQSPQERGLHRNSLGSSNSYSNQCANSRTKLFIHSLIPSFKREVTIAGGSILRTFRSVSNPVMGFNRSF